MDELINEINRIIQELPIQLVYSQQDLNTLTNLINQDSKYSIFENHCHTLGPNSSRCFNGLDFANALVARARKVGAEITLNEIQNYIDSNNIQIECGLLMYDVNIENEYVFSNGVKLIKAINVNDSSLIQFLSKESISTGGIGSSFLVIDYESPKQFFNSITNLPTFDYTKLEIKSDLIQIVDDTRLILALSRGPRNGIPVVACFEIIPESLEILNSGIGFNPYSEPRTTFGPSIIGIQTNRANELLNNFNAMTEESKDKIRIAMKRLNDSKIDSNWPNKCINLRICLENLFYIPTDNVIAKNVSERMALHTSFSKTRTRKIYGFLSGAVHSGKTPQHPTITVQEITNEVQNVIIKFIENRGYPNWISTPEKSKWQKFIKCIKDLFKKND
jgi:hypothetical protein